MEEFYVVSYNGILQHYKKIGYDEKNVPKWSSMSMMDCSKYEEWKIIEIKSDECKCKFVSIFTEEYAKTIDGFFIKEDFELAKISSMELYNKYFAPNSKYKVARYFDDVFECYVTGELNKKDADEKKQSLNKKTRCYVYYDIVKCIDLK